MPEQIRGLVLALAISTIAPAKSAEPEFVIQIRNHQFIPAELRIPAGVKVQIVIDNQDDTADEFESYSLNREKHVPPKSRVTIFVGPLAAGRYVYQGEDRTNGAAALGVVEAR
jgi:hypothetical protein